MLRPPFCVGIIHFPYFKKFFTTHFIHSLSIYIKWHSETVIVLHLIKYVPWIVYFFLIINNNICRINLSEKQFSHYTQYLNAHFSFIFKLHNKTEFMYTYIYIIIAFLNFIFFFNPLVCMLSTANIIKSLKMVIIICWSLSMFCKI